MALVQLDRGRNSGVSVSSVCERADRDGFGSVETVILKDDDGLARIVLAASNSPRRLVSQCLSTSP
jgi:hypothetical protein